MSEIQELDITIGPDGTVSIDVRGVVGPACETLTKSLEQALGGQVLERRRKDSYHQQAASDQAFDWNRQR